MLNHNQELALWPVTPAVRRCALSTRNRKDSRSIQFVIEPASDLSTFAQAASIREEVFEGELNIRVPRLAARNDDRELTLLARTKSSSEPAAVLTITETTGDQPTHERLGLSFRDGARVARYTQLAVRKQYRGLNLPVQLVLEGRRQFVLPRRIEHTWLLFDAERARLSSFCTLLGFRPSTEQFYTEYGLRRVLLHHEWEA
jgi:hypothetical protein